MEWKTEAALDWLLKLIAVLISRNTIVYIAVLDAVKYLMTGDGKQERIWSELLMKDVAAARTELNTNRSALHTIAEIYSR